MVKPVELGAPLPDEHYIMDDNKYIADILADFKSVKTREYQSKILFKKRMFRETDETITEPQFITLSYVQVCPASELQSTWFAPCKHKNNRACVGVYAHCLVRRDQGKENHVLGMIALCLLNYDPGSIRAPFSTFVCQFCAETWGCACTQAQHDYLAGNYPVVREDAAQMCALQMQAECGPAMLDNPDALETAIEQFVHKQVRLQSETEVPEQGLKSWQPYSCMEKERIFSQHVRGCQICVVPGKLF